jgi:hypothetical protein
MIQEVQTGRLFKVQSQSTPEQFYTVDLEAYTCHPCPSFPTISFCKHISAVEGHFLDLVKPHSYTPSAQPWDLPTDAPAAPTPTHTSPETSPESLPVFESDKLNLHYILHTLEYIRDTDMPLPPSISASLHQLNTVLTVATGGAETLPKTKQKVAPNTGSGWKSTTAVMGVERKGAKKRTHTDAYSGGQASGKLAPTDGRVSKKTRLSVVAETASAVALPPSNSAQEPENPFHWLASDDFVPNSDFSTALDSSDAMESAQRLFMEALHRYNQMFPPVVDDKIQKTPYYRENTYNYST